MMRNFFKHDSDRSHEEQPVWRPLRRYADEGAPRPLEARIEPRPNGLTITIPLRLEHVTFEKRTVVVDEVVVRRGSVQDAETVTDTVRREELDVDTSGDPGVTERIKRSGPGKRRPLR